MVALCSLASHRNRVVGVYPLFIEQPPNVRQASDNATKTAWTIGGGGERMFAPRWSAKLEYLHVDTNDTSVKLFNTTFTGRAKNNILRVGMNYHF